MTDERAAVTVVDYSDAHREEMLELALRSWAPVFGQLRDTAIRFARYFGNSEEFWMNLRSNDELRIGHQAPGDRLADIEPLATA